MKKFLVLYRTPVSVIDDWKATEPAARKDAEEKMRADWQKFWAEHGCLIVQPYNSEVGAGTYNPATFLRALGPEPWNVAYVEPSRRPTDGRYGDNPFRLQHYYQYQVVLKPAPELLTPEIVTLELPEFVRVTPSVLVAPVSILPKLKLAGLALSTRLEALTVRTAELLVALPTALLTTAENCAPLSVVVSAGVV